MKAASALMLVLLAADISSGQDIAAVLEKIPAKARVKQNPLEGDADALIAGKKLFYQHCAECHGESAGGSKRGPRLRDLLAGATPGEIFWILTNGVVRRGMPEWSRLPEPQRWQIVGYLQSLQATESFTTSHCSAYFRGNSRHRCPDQSEVNSPIAFFAPCTVPRAMGPTRLTPSSSTFSI